MRLRRALFMARLHIDIVHFLNTLKQPMWQQQQRGAAFADIDNVVQSLWPMCRVDVFGSVATGLCLPDSDVDLVVLNVPRQLFIYNEDGPTQRISPTAMRSLAALLSSQAWCHSVVPLANASVPVIKLSVDSSVASNASVCSTTSAESEMLHTIPIDVTFARAGTVHSGIQSRQFVIEKWQQYPELEALVLVLKRYLRVRKLNDAYTGGLSSFSLTLLVVYFLENLGEFCPQVVLPRRQSWSGGAHPAHELYGELLWHFLGFFGRSFDFSTTPICVRGAMGAAAVVASERPSHFAVWIDNPLMPGTNVAASSFAMWRVKQAFCEAHDLLVSLLSAERRQCEQRWILQHLFDPQVWQSKPEPGLQFSHTQEGGDGRQEAAKSPAALPVLKRTRSQEQFHPALLGKSKLNKFEEV